MARDKADPGARLRELQRGFLERTDGEIAELESLYAGETLDRAEALASIERIAHRIAGGGGTFGFPELSTAAEALEQAAGRAQSEGGKTLEDLAPLVVELRRVHDALSPV
ncbi:Hpt domain-containing protein [Fodinicurvata halophila]|uniref:Hpt domain-containing protein n=1 Tax=Fodinicurvata halophila TaxID=1419723 RepID=A0ABV8UIM0_9PROT